jgi:ABC-type polysaccharide/polyol phosphate export permease
MLLIFQDFFRTRNLWVHLSRMDLLSRFRGTVLGLLWLIISQVGTFTITAYIWSKLFNVEFTSFLIYIGAGFAAWGFISNSIVIASSSIFTASSMYLNSLTPLSMGASRTVATNFYIMGIGMVVPIVISIWVHGLHAGYFLLFLLGLLLSTVMVFILSLFFSLVSIKYKDLTQGLGMLFQIFWTVTPVIYTEEMLQTHGLGFLSSINPLYWALYCVREPWLGPEQINLLNYSKLGILNIVGISLIALFYKHRSRNYLLYV